MYRFNQLVLSSAVCISLLSGCATTSALVDNVAKKIDDTKTFVKNVKDDIKSTVITHETTTDNKSVKLQKVFDSGRVSYIQERTSRIRPEFDGSKVYLATADGIVVAKNMNGDTLWQKDMQSDISAGLSYNKATDTLVFGLKNGKIIALQGKTGSLKWRQQLSSSILTPVRMNEKLNILVASSNNGMLHGLYLSNGMQAWKYRTTAPKISVRGTAIPVLHNNLAAFAKADGRIYVLKAKNGVPVWSKQIGEVKNNRDASYLKDVDASPVFHDGFMYSVSYDGNLSAYNLKTKQLKFSHKIASVRQLIIYKNLLVTVTTSNEVHAYNRLTGELLWKNTAINHHKLSNPVVMHDLIAVGNSRGYLYLLDPKDGSVIRKEQTDTGFDYFEVINAHLISQDKKNNVTIWK